MTTTSGISGASNDYSKSSGLTKSSQTSSMDMNDFMKLLVAQLTNQDVMNPMDNTEFIAQMAQFSALQAMKDMSSISSMQYASSLVGKNVTVAKYDEDGKYVQDEGAVTRANFSGDETTITVNGTEYGISSVMEVVSAPTTTPAAITTPDTTTTPAG